MTSQEKIDDYQLPKLDRLSAPDRFDAIDSIFTQADEKGVVAPLPGTHEEVRLTELNESRICTIRTRLYLLGYLKRDNHSPRIGDRLKSAIHRFQIEAGLEADSWVGRQTWTALQELVSFEHPSNLDKWFSKEPLKPALLRAIKLRLFVLGFLPSKQARNNDKLQAALDKFVLVARILRLHGKKLPAAPVLETVEILFDQDLLAARLGQAGKDFMKFLPPDIPEKQARHSIYRFSVFCAKIELWLLGYDVPLDDKVKYDTPGQNEMFSYLPKRYPVYHALYSFWCENGKDPKKARERARHISGKFFAKLLQLQQEGAHIEDSNQSEQLYKILADEEKEVLEEVWIHIKSIGSRIWDGIKRVWRWFKSLFKTVVEKISAWVKNIARLAYRYALNAFPIACGLIKIAKDTASFLIDKTLKNSDVACIVINRDNDYDYRLYIRPLHKPDKMKATLAEFYRKAYNFNIGMRVLGIIGSTLISVIKSVPLGAGWFGLILALLKIYNALKNLSDLFDEERAFRAVV